MPRMPKAQAYTDGIKRIVVPVEHTISIRDITYILNYAMYVHANGIDDIMNGKGTRAAQKANTLKLIKNILKYDGMGEVTNCTYNDEARKTLDRAKYVAVSLFPDLVTPSAEE